MMHGHTYIKLILTQNYFWCTDLFHCIVLVMDLLKVPNSYDRGQFLRMVRVEVPLWNGRSAAFSWWSVMAAGCNMGVSEMLADEWEVSFIRTKYNYAFRIGWSRSLYSLTTCFQPMNYTNFYAVFVPHQRQALLHCKGMYWAMIL